MTNLYDFFQIQIYWVGPILGAIAAALIYTQVFKAPELDNVRAQKYSVVADEKEVS
jgi:aquaporin related protein